MHREPFTLLPFPHIKDTIRDSQRWIVHSLADPTPPPPIGAYKPTILKGGALPTRHQLINQLLLPFRPDFLLRSHYKTRPQKKQRHREQRWGTVMGTAHVGFPCRRDPIGCMTHLFCSMMCHAHVHLACPPPPPRWPYSSPPPILEP